MSRIGRAPITVPAGVEITVGEGNHITVKGPKGTLERKVAPQMLIEIENGVLHVKRPNDEKQNCALHGLTRTLVNDMVVGVTQGFSKTLEIQGVGYRAQKEGKNLVMNLGFSHRSSFPRSRGSKSKFPMPTTSSSRAWTSRRSAVCCGYRMKRPPEPYKGKGIRYQGEVVRIKEGKTGAK